MGGRPGPPAALLLAVAAAACASGRAGVDGAHDAHAPGGRAALPAAAAVEPEGPPPAGRAVAAAAGGDRDATYALVLETVRRCGTRPLAQQALLLLAASELDPRNPEARLSVAREATKLVLESSPPDVWTRVLAESLYLVSLRLGAGANPAAAGELRSRSERADRNGSFPAPEPCDPLPWPSSRGAGAGELPALDGASYPARVAWLQRRVDELEAEIARLRRITREP